MRQGAWSASARHPGDLIQILRYPGYPVNRRKSGGETSKVAVFPCGANLESFDWRQFIASLQRTGRFSSLIQSIELFTWRKMEELPLPFVKKIEACCNSDPRPYGFQRMLSLTPRCSAEPWSGEVTEGEGL
ncbi:HutD family protein [Shimia sp. CNT1-13L.2]|uniref:HutD family protein n=1 Tax=Shimia sp. CNT1-13L.2 TaxID=2959663 RepID=UPI0034E983D4